MGNGEMRKCGNGEWKTKAWPPGGAPSQKQWQRQRIGEGKSHRVLEVCVKKYAASPGKESRRLSTIILV